MKHFLTLILASLFLISCSNSAQKGMTNSSYESTKWPQNKSQGDNFSLEYLLRRTAGLHVVGSGNNLSVRVRGPQFKSNSEPLYIVNSNPIGNSYKAAANLVKDRRIVSVKVLKGTAATRYDLRGAGGIILIETE